MQRAHAGLAGGALFSSAARAADDSCAYARDGECDAPVVCPPGTDSTDCGSAAAASSVAEGAEAGLGNLWEQASTGDGLIAVVLLLAAAWVLMRRVAAPRSGLLTTALLLLALGLGGLRWLPEALLDPLFTLSNALELGPSSLLLLAGVGLVLYVLARQASGPSAGSAMQTVARAALNPDIKTTDHDEISAARRQCQAVAHELEAKLRPLEGRFHLYAQYDAVSQPWLQVDRLSTDEHGAFIASLRMEFKPQPFGMYPVLVDFEVDDRGRRRRVSSVVELGSAQLDALVTCLKGEGPRYRWQGQRLREWPWQLWRPRQLPTVLESPFLAGMRANIKIILLLLAGLGLFFAWSAAPGPMTVLLLGAALAWRHWYVPAPRYRLANGCPARPPRSLRGLDSWQAVVRDLGSQRDDVVQRLESSLAQRLVGTDEPVTIRREDIWYEGADGKVERQQLTISLRRAIVFVRIYPYGSDLFVGWDAHVNQLAWKEQAVHSGHRASDGVKVQLVAVTTQVQPINEYDITDANFLLEATHLHLTSLLKDVLRERAIDQELDFSIVRESRQGLVAAEQAPRRRMFSRA